MACQYISSILLGLEFGWKVGLASFLIIQILSDILLCALNILFSIQMKVIWFIEREFERAKHPPELAQYMIALREDLKKDRDASHKPTVIKT